MLWVFLTVLVVLAVAVAVDRWLRHEEFDKIPGPKGVFLLENALEFLMDPVRLFYYFRFLANKYKHLFKLRLGPKKIIIIHNPEDVEIIISGAKNTKKGFLYRFIQPWLQEGLLLSDGIKWLHRRKILTPAFHFNILKIFSTVLQENSRNLVEQLKHEINSPETNISSFITDFTLNSICETAMGTKLDPETSDVGKRYREGIHTIGQIIVHRSQRIWMYPESLFSLTNVGRKHKQILNLLSTFRDNIIKKRRQSNNQNNDTYEDLLDEDTNLDYEFGFGKKKKLAMLDVLLQAEREGIIDAKGIGEEVDTFMFEGHDTTSTALQFAFMLLANNENCQNKIVDECAEIFGSSTREATMSDLGKMKYLECCIKESLRLYPPVAFIMRKIDQPLKLKHHEIPGGIDCAILIYDLHRRGDQFVEPQEFRPERFLAEPTWHPFGYIPFSAGPRNCIGQKFAMMEMKIVLSAVLRQYRLLPVTRPQDVVFVTDFILRNKYPVYVKIEKRN